MIDSSVVRNRCRIIEWLDIRFFMPAISRMPLPLAHRMADLRGLIRYRLDLDWRSSCLGAPFVREKTARVLENVFNINPPEPAVRERFRTQSREEIEAFFILNRRPGWPVCHTVTPPGWERRIPKGGGVVLLAAHLDSSWAGMGFLSRFGRPVNAVYDPIVYDPGVFPFFQDFFRRKYEGIIRHYNGGTLLSPEDLRREGAARLKRGEMIIFFADIPRKDRGLPARFLGRDVLVPYGGPSYAARTGSYMAAYVTRFLMPGRYESRLSAPVPVSEKTDLPQLVQGIYSVLDGQIREDPGKWWAADTFFDHIKLDSTCNVDGNPLFEKPV